MLPLPRRAIAWFRRDLRINDNRMLEEATASAERVWPVWVADPAMLGHHAAATRRTAWFFANVQALDARLRSAGSGLTVLAGPPEAVLPEFARSVGADVVFASADDEPMATRRDARVGAKVDLRLVNDQRVLPGGLRTGSGGPYRVYSPFRRALERWLEETAEAELRASVTDPARLAPPTGVFELGATPATLSSPPAGEKAASRRLETFVSERLRSYRDDRDRPDLPGTSRLSPYLRVGAISPRALWRAAREAVNRARTVRDGTLARSAATWQAELVWREFFADVLRRDPSVTERPFRAAYEAIEWVGGDEAEELLAAWRGGRTGYPLVDAGMRELSATGWMHNRARLVTASFLVKDLGVDWRRGEAVFAELLLDADTAQNNGNWQWVAGVGTDAAPYFRVFSPTAQAKRFDPEGAYVRRWLPELDGVSTEHVHEPWRAPTPPADYPPPLVDHLEARRRTLARYRAAEDR